MAVYIHSSVSHSACGNSYLDPSLRFSTVPNTRLEVTTNIEDDPQYIHFFAMHQIPLDSSEARLFSSLTSVFQQLIDNSELTSSDLAQTALLLGSTSLDIGTLTPSQDKALGLPKIDRLSQYLQQYFGLHPYNLVVNTACTASINAVSYGKKLLEQTAIKQVIVVGCEFYNKLTTAGFHSLDLLSSEQLLAFHEKRQGLILGEGIGALLLSENKPSKKQCYQILESDSACDTSSLTMTVEDGSHITTVINQAITKSGLNPKNINLVKVHGTATYNNDLAEFNAFNNYFDDLPPVLALKPFIGHTLGACGVIELALLDYLLTQETLPVPSYVSEHPQSILLPFAEADKAIKSFKHILINHCGFGGNNAALVLETV